jgi:hypothetical protein
MMIRPVSTKAHGILDYLSVGTLLALPRMMGWSANVTRLLTFAALGTLVYSLTTRYEFSITKLLPMKTHLLLDAMSGVMLGSSPLIFNRENPMVKRALIGLGLFEISAALLTKPQDSKR